MTNEKLQNGQGRFWKYLLNLFSHLYTRVYECMYYCVYVHMKNKTVELQIESNIR